MSRLVERWSDYNGPVGFAVALSGDHEGLPELSALLEGKIAPSGLAWERPPYKLLLWLEGSLVKWCLTAGDDKPKLWGTSPGLAEGLLGIEDAICKERCEWKRPSNGKVGLTHR